MPSIGCQVMVPPEQWEREKKAPPTRKAIQYNADDVRPAPDAELVLEDDMDLKAHTLLRFILVSKEYMRMEKFVELEMLEHKTFDWKLIDMMGQRERIEAMLVRGFGVPRAPTCRVRSLV